MALKGRVTKYLGACAGELPKTTRGSASATSLRREARQRDEGDARSDPQGAKRAQTALDRGRRGARASGERKL